MYKMIFDKKKKNAPDDGSVMSAGTTNKNKFKPKKKIRYDK